jgi:hypothetical protein
MGKAQRIASRHNEDVEEVDDATDDATDDSSANEQDDSEDEGEHDEQPGRKEARYRKQRNEYRRQLRQVKAELEKVRKGRSSASTDMAMELAFIRAAAAEGVTDVEAAWKLCDRKLLSWEDDDDDDEEPQLVGIGDALEKVLDRYPYVAHSTERSAGGRKDADDRVQPPHATTSGRPTNGKKQGHQTIDRAYLERKYPALQRHRSHRPPLG